MNYSVIGLAHSVPTYNPIACSICGSNKGLLLPCTNKGCRKAVHPYCAFQSRAKIQRDDPSTAKGWNILFEINQSDPSSTSPEIFNYLQQSSPDQIIAIAASQGKNIEPGKLTQEIILEALENKKRVSERKHKGGFIRILCEEHKYARPSRCICGKDTFMSNQNNFLVMCTQCGIF